MRGVYFMLEVEDPFNFGHTIRALYAAGVTGLVFRPELALAAGLSQAPAARSTLPMFRRTQGGVRILQRTRIYRRLRGHKGFGFDFDTERRRFLL